MVISQPGICHLCFGPYINIKMFLRLGQVFFYIVTFVGKRLVAHMDWPNTEGSNLKSYLIRFWTLVWICTWLQIVYYHYNKLIR
jgi:hypothetical protein